MSAKAAADVAVALGRRERKKLAARTAILDASSELFLEKGFEGTRIESIAERADVGVGTVYNHFETKADILVAILFSDVSDVLERTRSIVERGGPNAGRMTADAVGVLLEVMDRRARNLWRDLIGHALLDGAKLGAAYERSEFALRGVIRRGLERLRENGNLGTPSLALANSIEDATDVVFSIAKTSVYSFVFEPGLKRGAVAARLEQLVAAVFPW